MRVGIEVGGTFTDLVAVGAGGIEVTKVPSTPSAPDEGAMSALSDSGVQIKGIEELAHGSTISTNAILERKGFRAAFVTTAGFRDLLAIQRHNRISIYDLQYQKPVPLIDRADWFEVEERISHDGTVLVSLNRESVQGDLLPGILSGKFEAVAICLLNSFANPTHEEELRRLITALAPNLYVTISSEITREFREYERASTTAMSAYVQPVIDRYLNRLEGKLEEKGFVGHFSVMQSNGGRLPARAMRGNAVNSLLSGPAAGVTGAVYQAARADFRNLITLDIGGTSTDVCLVNDCRPQMTSEFQIDGLPIRIPLLDIKTVGAGGGSIIWIDEGGMLRVGPRSAGAEPGPACYGRGGQYPTITDAHVIRQTIRPEAFLGGRMSISADASARALSPIAKRFHLTLQEAADSAIQLANAHVVRAIQLISTERGKDPRDYVLVPYGGAGPLHAAHVAEDLGISTVVVPPSAGVISAYGLIASDFVQYDSMTRRRQLDSSGGEFVRTLFAEMRSRAASRFSAMGFANQLDFTFIADMRFVGQAFEVPVELQQSQIGMLTAEHIRDLFSTAHQRMYFFGAETGRAIEFVSFRLGVTARLGSVPILTPPQREGLSERSIDFFDNGKVSKGLLLSRSSVPAGRTIPGPALLEETTSTIFVPLGWQAESDVLGNIILRKVE